MNPHFKYVGELPPGDWRFLLVAIKGSADVVVVVDMKGQHAPRMVVDGRLVNVAPC